MGRLKLQAGFLFECSITYYPTSSKGELVTPGYQRGSETGLPVVKAGISESVDIPQLCRKILVWKMRQGGITKSFNMDILPFWKNRILQADEQKMILGRKICLLEPL